MFLLKTHLKPSSSACNNFWLWPLLPFCATAAAPGTWSKLKSDWTARFFVERWGKKFDRTKKKILAFSRREWSRLLWIAPSGSIVSIQKHHHAEHLRSVWKALYNLKSSSLSLSSSCGFTKDRFCICTKVFRFIKACIHQNMCKNPFINPSQGKMTPCLTPSTVQDIKEIWDTD